MSAGHRVLVVTPSHAACDAITLALAQHWPGDISGQVSGEDLASDWSIVITAEHCDWCIVCNLLL